MITRAPLTERRKSLSGRRGDQGFTLLAVVAVVFLLALVVSTLMRSASAVMATARSATNHAAAEFLADGVSRLVMRHLALTPLEETRSGRLPTTGIPAYCTIADTAVSISVTPASGQIDLNAASRNLLAFTLKGAGLSEDQAQTVADGIIDYRSLGDAALDGSSKRDQYARAGLGFGPKMSPFTTADELDQVVGVSRDVFTAISPLFTVRSSRAVDPMKASYPVVLSLLGRGLEASPLPATDEDISRWRRELVLPIELQPPTKTRTANVIRATPLSIEVTVFGPMGTRFTRKLVAALRAGSGDQGRILEWSQGDKTRQSAPARGQALPSCLGEVLWLNK